jgi:hypothetical protein
MNCFTMRKTNETMARVKHGGWAGLMISLAWVSGPLAAAQLESSGLGPLEGGPSIEVAERVHDFGRLPPGDSRQHEFVYRNVGSVPLEIQQVRTSCGCTTAGEWDRRVEPGATGRVAIKFDTANYSGALQRNVTLVTNDPRQPQLVLQVKAQIWAPIEVNPKTVMFQYDSESTEGETRVVRLTSHLDEPLTFASVRSEHPGFRATLETVKPGQEFSLQISTVPPVGTGTITTTVVLEPADTNVAPVRVMAYALERQPLSISPVSLVLPAGQARPGARPSVTIRNNTTQPLELSDPSINLEGVEVEVKELQAGRFFTLTLQLPEGFEFPTGQRIELTVKTSQRRQPEIRVPVIQARQAIPTPRAPLPTRTGVRVQPPPAPPPPARGLTVDR